MTPSTNKPESPLAHGFTMPTRDEVARLFVTPTTICIKTPRDYSNELSPLEKTATSSMGERRLADYSTGRACARTVLGELGHHEHSLVSGSDRQPLWPDGTCGSISHCEGVAVAVVTADPRCRGLGVDVERITLLEQAVIEMICTEAELATLQDLPADLRPIQACLIFSIKESLFKCFHPVFGVWFDFQQASVSLAPDRRSFETVFDPGLPFAGVSAENFTGRCAVLDGVVASSAQLLHG